MKRKVKQMKNLIKLLFFAVILFPNLVFAQAPRMTATAWARQSATANPTNIVRATQTKVAYLSTATQVAAVKTAAANTRMTQTAVARLTEGITCTFSWTLTPTKTVTTVCTATLTQTSDTRGHAIQTKTQAVIQTQTALAIGSRTPTFTPTFTFTGTVSPTAVNTTVPTITPTIGLTFTNYGKNNVSLVWNAPAYTDGGYMMINSTPVVYTFPSGSNPKTVTNLTMTANISPGKNIISVVSRWWDSGFGKGVTLTSNSTAFSVYNISGIDPITAQNKLNVAGLLANEVSITAQNAATGYVFVTKYATDRIIFDIKVAGATATSFQVFTGGNVDTTNTGCASGGTVKGMGNFAANTVCDIIPPANAMIVPSNTWAGVSITSGGADQKTIQWINCDLADYAKMKP